MNGQAHYGEDHPRPPDDRLPMILVLLDGLGDRAHDELRADDGADIGEGTGSVRRARTASEAAQTLVLDELARRAQCGVHVPLGWGRAPSSEIAHWSMFGLGEVPFPGRTRFEAIGRGLTPTPGTLLLFAALRPSNTDADGRIWITGRVNRNEPDVARQLLANVSHYETPSHRFELTVFDRGEAILTISSCTSQPIGNVTDSDPFFEHLHPMLKPRAVQETWASGSDQSDGESTAAALNEYLRWVRTTLAADPLNAARTAEGLPVLDTLTTKWSSVVGPVPTFEEVVGLQGAMVTTSPFYRGMGKLLGMRTVDAGAGEWPLVDALNTALHLHQQGAQFVHVHTKVTDEAGHTKDPHQKRAAVEWCDRQLQALLTEPFSRWVVAVTGDHATPASGGVLHTGDPTPFVICAPTARPDRVGSFGEDPCRDGLLGMITATDVMPLMCSHANRPLFLGHRPTPHATIALPDYPEAFQ